MDNLLLTFVLLPLAGALLAWRWQKRETVVFWALIVINFLLAAGGHLLRSDNASLVWRFFGQPWLVLDSLSHLFLLAGAGVFLLTALFGAVTVLAGRFGGSRLLLLLAGFNVFVLSGDVVLLVAAYAGLVGSIYFFGGTEEENRRFRTDFALAGLALVLGSLLLVFFAKTTSLASAALSPLYFKEFLAGLFFLPLVVLAGVVPFHGWLIARGGALPPPLAGLIYGAVNSAAIYGILRLGYNVFGSFKLFSSGLILCGLLSLLLGGLPALLRQERGRQIALHNLTQNGLLFIALALSTPLGLMAALYQLFNQSLLKPLISGADQELQEQGGWLVFVAVLVFWLSTAALPPFGQFWSYHYLVLAGFQSGNFWLAGLLVGGGLLLLGGAAAYLQKNLFSGAFRLGGWPGKASAAALLLGLSGTLLYGLLSTPLVLRLINPAVIALAGGVRYARLILGGL